MPRAKTKDDLINQAQMCFSELWQFIKEMPEQARKTEFDFCDDPTKKELHWKRDKNLRDVLIHLYEWHQLLLKWIHSNLAGEQRPFLPEPYNWKNYGDMNVEFWKKHQGTDILSAQVMVKESHKAVLELIEKFTNEELFTKQYYNWTGTTTLGSYCVSAMPSHYEWAIKKLRAHVKKVS